VKSSYLFIFYGQLISHHVDRKGSVNKGDVCLTFGYFGGFKLCFRSNPEQHRLYFVVITSGQFLLDSVVSRIVVCGAKKVSWPTQTITRVCRRRVPCQHTCWLARRRESWSTVLCTPSTASRFVYAQCLHGKRSIYCPPSL